MCFQGSRKQMPRWNYTSNTFLKRSASKRRKRERQRTWKELTSVMRSDTCEGRGRMKDCVLRVSDCSRVLKKCSD